jgi:Fe-S cluster biogenesis protein NfuA
MSDNNLDKLNKILDEVRPALQRDGGDLILVEFDDKEGIVKIHFTGACANCSLADVTLHHLIEHRIREDMPEIKQVMAV